jgi:Amt family ammonium transporter
VLSQTLAVGIFGSKAGLDQLGSQAIGILSVGAFCTITAFIILFTLKKTIGIRVSEIEEIEGLDLHEHGMSAYSDFRMNEH